MLAQMVQEEMNEKTVISPNKVSSLTLSEAKIYLVVELRKDFDWKDTSEEEKNKIIGNVFSEKYFSVGGTPSPHIDIMTMTEPQLFTFLNSVTYLSDAIFGTSDTHDHMAKEHHRIDPRVFLLPAEKVRKWFYTVYPSWQRMSVDQYESTDKQTLRPQLFSKYFTFLLNPGLPIIDLAR